MNHAQQIDGALAEAIEETNRQLPADRQLTTDPGTVLVGDGGVLDSLGLLAFLVAVEQRIAARCSAQVALVGADLTEAGGPLSSLGALADYLVAALEDG